MELRISDTTMITSDTHQFTIQKLSIRINKDTGKEYEHRLPIRYFTTLKRALESLPEQMLKDSNAVGWRECQDIISNGYHLIHAAMEVSDD